MIGAHLLAISILWTVVASPLAYSADLSSYREFQFGMNPTAVAELASMNASDIRVIHQRPALIQELAWQPTRYPGSLPDGDPMKGILFSFCNGELFRMAVNYDRYKIEGISAKYGTAARPPAEIIFPSIYNETVKVIARWEDAQYSFNLVRSSYQPAFGMILCTKRLDALYRTALAEALRLDEQEAPQREIDSQRKQADEKRVKEEKARLVNKASFRP